MTVTCLGTAIFGTAKSEKYMHFFLEDRLTKPISQIW